MVFLVFFIFKKGFLNEKFQIKKIVPEKTKSLPSENFNETPTQKNFNKLNRGLDQRNCNQTKINIQGQLVVSCVGSSNSEKTCFHMNINLTLTSENASRCMFKPAFS